MSMPTNQEARDRMRSEAIALLYFAIDRKATRKELHQEMLKMEEKYPGLGWKEYAFKLMSA